MAAPKPEDDLASLVTAALAGHQKQSAPLPNPHPAPDPDFPAESFRLPPEAELEWLDRSVAAAAIYERDDSTKGTANPKAQHQHHNGGNNQQHHGSNRFSGPLKPRKSAILGLPKPVERHSGYIGRKGRGNKSMAIFPKKNKGKGKGKVKVEEPGSPKVSWFGKVGSDRERCREEKRRMRREVKQEVEREEKASRGGGSAGRFWTCLLGPLACCRGNHGAVGSVEEDTEKRTSASSSSSSDKKKTKDKANRMKNHRTASSDSFSNPSADRSDASSTAADPPGLGAMKRFVSGRRPSSWGGGEFEAGGESVIASSGGEVHTDGPGAMAPGRRSVS